MKSDSTRHTHGTGVQSASPERVECERTWTIAGPRLAELLRATRESMLRDLSAKQASKDYRRQAAFIMDECARFCDQQEPAHAWLLRRNYLESRAELRSNHAFSESYLVHHGSQLRYFLRWYLARVEAGDVAWGELSAGQLNAYWAVQQPALPYRRRLLSIHLGPMLLWLQQRPPIDSSDELGPVVIDYLQQRRLTMRGKGYGLVFTHRARIVTRRHLLWLEQQGQLPEGTAIQGARWRIPAPSWAAGISDSLSGGRGIGRGDNESQALLDYVTARLDSGLPQSLRQPLLEYMEHLICDRELVQSSIESSLRTNLALCRKMAESGKDSFSQLRVSLLDEVVSSLLRAPQHDLIHRRQQVRGHHSRLRGLLRYLYRRGLVDRDLAPALISPPCYRDSTPPTVLSEHQLQRLLESVDRHHPRGRRCYAVLTLMTTYGMRPVDVCRLGLDDLRWSDKRIALVQSKTGRVLALPLLPQVAAALQDYLRHDRPPGLCARQVFVSLDWPHRAVRSVALCADVARALADCGLSWARARHLRATVATHLLRQGEGLSTIQELLGHRTAETTQRYAVTDLEMLRRVLEETDP